jgi:predicted metal-dependent hydrolase
MKIIHTRRKTIALVIENDGSLVVRAPYRVGQKEIERIVLEKTDWIRERQAYARKHFGAPHQFENGELFYYLGNAYPLRVVDIHTSPLFSKNSFQMGEKDQAHAPRIFTDWYRRQARQIINERASSLASQHHLMFKGLRITSARSRWGSCSSRGVLNFPWRLVMVPLEIIDYVIVHELAHLKIQNHSKQFWSYLEQLHPNYRTQRKWLRENVGKFNL